MASLGNLETLIDALPANIRKPMRDIVTEIVTQLRLGHPTGDTKDPMTNFGGAFLHGTTPATPGDELALSHQFGRTPYLAFGVLRLDAVGSSAVPLTVSRVADDKRVYLTSTVASAPFSIAVEG